MNKYFNKKLYQSSLNDIRVYCYIFTVLCTLINGFILLDQYFTITTKISRNILSPDYTISLQTNEFYLLIVLLNLILFAPLVTIASFSFLTKRNQSDFYHSIPYKRICIFISKIAAIVTGIFITTFLPFIVLLLINQFTKTHVLVDFSSLFQFNINIFIGSLLIVAAISIASSLSGTTFNTVIFSGIILFVPRFLVMMFTSFIEASYCLIGTYSDSRLLSYDSNIILNLLAKALDDADGLSEVSSSTLGFPSLYSTILAIIYLVIGCVLFNKRKSEAAGNPTTSKTVQTISRFIVGFLCTLPSISIIFEMYYDKNNAFTSINIFSAFIWFLFAFAIMFLYELISFRNLKKAVSTLKTSPIVVAISAVFLGILVVSYNSVTSYEPDSKDIEYIKFNYYNEAIWVNTDDENYQAYTEYFSEYTKNIKITDEKIKEIVSSTLKDNNFKLKNNNDGTSYNYFYNHNTVNITICSDGSEHSRIINMTSKDYETLEELFFKNIDFKEAVNNIPDSVEKVSFIDCSFSDYLDKLNTASLKKIYPILIKEIKANPQALADCIIQNDSPVFYRDSMIAFSFYYDSKLVVATLPITESFKESLSLYISMMNSQTLDKIDEFISLLTNSYDTVYNGTYLAIAIDDIHRDFNSPDSNNKYYYFENTYGDFKSQNLSEEELEKLMSDVSLPSKEEEEFLKTLASYIQNPIDENTPSTLYRVTISKGNSGIYYDDFYEDYYDDSIYSKPMTEEVDSDDHTYVLYVKLPDTLILPDDSF